MDEHGLRGTACDDYPIDADHQITKALTIIVGRFYMQGPADSGL